MNRLLLLLFILTTTLLSGEIPDDYLGYTPKTLIERVGAPDMTLVERGRKKAEDDVVFYYNNRTYFYFNQSRVWQVRFDKKYNGELLGFTLGASRDDVLELLGEPIKTHEDSIVFKRPDKGYPVFLRIFFKNDKVEDVYFYRGDY